MLATHTEKNEGEYYVIRKGFLVKKVVSQNKYNRYIFLAAQMKQQIGNFQIFNLI